MSKRKNPCSSDNPNADFCDFLIELADFEKNISRNVHKYNAYRKAAGVLASLEKRIKSGEEARKLKGIGDKISKKIDEYLQTGKLRKLDEIHKDESVQSISLLAKVSGIGPVKAAELAKKGIQTIDDLEKHKELLNHHQILGLKYYDDFNKKIPREEIEEIEKTLRELICNLDKNYTITICGSFRRGKAESGDIDVLITHPSVESKIPDKDRKALSEKLLKSVVNTLTTHGVVVDTISVGETKFMGVCRLAAGSPARRLDIRLTSSDQYHCAVLYFTGSDVFNKTMRAHALQHGFTLNEYALKPVGNSGVAGNPVPISSEEEIFDYINFPYKKPEERNL